MEVLIICNVNAKASRWNALTFPMRIRIAQVMVSQAMTSLFWMTLTYVWPFCGYFNARSDATRSAPTKPRLGMNQPLGICLPVHFYCGHFSEPFHWITNSELRKEKRCVVPLSILFRKSNKNYFEILKVKVMKRFTEAEKTVLDSKNHAPSQC